MQFSKNLFKKILQCFCIILLTSCARSAQVYYYQLTTPPSSPGDGQILNNQKNIGIGPLTLPSYLDRPQIVTRFAANRLQLSDTHRWAEPLHDNIRRVLLENLSQKLHTDKLQLHPWPAHQGVDLQLVVDIIHFETDDTGTALLETRWSVRDAEGKTILSERKKSVSVPPDKEGVAGQVEALSEALNRLCTEIAAKLAPLLDRSTP